MSMDRGGQGPSTDLHLSCVLSLMSEASPTAVLSTACLSREVLSCARFLALLALHWILQAHHSEDRDAWILPSSSAPGPAHPCALGTDKNSLLISEPSSSSQTALLHTQVSAPQGAPRRYTAEKDLWVARAKLQKSPSSSCHSHLTLQPSVQTPGRV